MASRQTVTGIRTCVSLCQGTGCTDNDPRAPLNTVPLNSRISGTSPSSRAARYLLAATSTSYDIGSTSSKSQDPVNVGSTWAKKASCIGCMVLPQRSRSPNRSTTLPASPAP